MTSWTNWANSTEENCFIHLHSNARCRYGRTAFRTCPKRVDSALNKITFYQLMPEFANPERVPNSARKVHDELITEARRASRKKRPVHRYRLGSPQRGAARRAIQSRLICSRYRVNCREKVALIDTDRHNSRESVLSAGKINKCVHDVRRMHGKIAYQVVERIRKHRRPWSHWLVLGRRCRGRAIELRQVWRLSFGCECFRNAHMKREIRYFSRCRFAKKNLRIVVQRNCYGAFDEWSFARSVKARKRTFGKRSLYERATVAQLRNFNGER